MGQHKEDSRYPYTYACDYLRTKVGAHISRSEMSQIRSLIAAALGMDDRFVAEMLANEFQRLDGNDFDNCAKPRKPSAPPLAIPPEPT